MTAKAEVVRALKRLERAARDAARAIAQEREEARTEMLNELSQLGIRFVDAKSEEDIADGN